MIQCRICKADKPEADFHTDKRTGTPWKRCKACLHEREKQRLTTKYGSYELGVRNRWLLSEYGIDNDAYNDILNKQDFKCPICERSVADIFIHSNRAHSLPIDHSHDEEKRVRGVLCHPCNLMIGHYEKLKKLTGNNDILSNVQRYLGES